MYLPKIYEKFTSQYPDVFKDLQQLGKTCRESGPLQKKYQDLANLGIAIGANSRGAVMSQTQSVRIPWVPLCRKPARHWNPVPAKKKSPRLFYYH